MANGQQEQESVVTGQDPALNQPQNPEQGVLQGMQQQPQQQPQQIQQPANLYQALGSLNPQQLLQLKSNVQKRAGRRQIYRNVGGDRGAQLISLAEKGEMTIAEAINRSKQELTPNMKAMDAAFFAKGATAASMLPLKETMKNSWSKTERNLWLSHYNSLDRQETSAENARIQGNKNITKDNKARFKNSVDNRNFTQLAQVDFLDIESTIEEGSKEFGKFGADPAYIKAVEGFRSEYGKDLNANISEEGDQIAMQQYAVQIAKTIPISFINKERGYMIGNEWIVIPEKGMDENSKRKLFAESIIRKIISAKNHMAQVSEYFETQQPPEDAPAEGGGDDWSQYMVE